MQRNTKKWQISITIILLSITVHQQAICECGSSLKLEGTVSVQCCTPADQCVSAGEAMNQYVVSAKDDPSTYSIIMHASPWHLYDGEYRILTIEELARMIKPKLRSGIKSVELFASWTNVTPSSTSKSIAQKLSLLLDGFPVSGMDGFVWIAKDGSVRTTRQAFTIRQICPYEVHPGEEIMVSLVAGWPILFAEDFFKKNDSEGIMRAGAGWDIYMLCPDNALKLFKEAAKRSNPIAAYNAALILLERGNKDDLKTATALLKQAAELGDKKALARLTELSLQGN